MRATSLWRDSVQRTGVRTQGDEQTILLPEGSFRPQISDLEDEGVDSDFTPGQVNVRNFISEIKDCNVAIFTIWDLGNPSAEIPLFERLMISAAVLVHCEYFVIGD